MERRPSPCFGSDAGPSPKRRRLLSPPARLGAFVPPELRRRSTPLTMSSLAVELSPVENIDPALAGEAPMSLARSAGVEDKSSGWFSLEYEDEDVVAERLRQQQLDEEVERLLRDRQARKQELEEKRRRAKAARRERRKTRESLAGADLRQVDLKSPVKAISGSQNDAGTSKDDALRVTSSLRAGQPTSEPAAIPDVAEDEPPASGVGALVDTLSLERGHTPHEQPTLIDVPPSSHLPGHTMGPVEAVANRTPPPPVVVPPTTPSQVTSPSGALKQPAPAIATAVAAYASPRPTPCVSRIAPMGPILARHSDASPSRPAVEPLPQAEPSTAPLFARYRPEGLESEGSEEPHDDDIVEDSQEAGQLPQRSESIEDEVEERKVIEINSDTTAGGAGDSDDDIRQLLDQSDEDDISAVEAEIMGPIAGPSEPSDTILEVDDDSRRSGRSEAQAVPTENEEATISISEADVAVTYIEVDALAPPRVSQMDVDMLEDDDQTNVDLPLANQPPATGDSGVPQHLRSASMTSSLSSVPLSTTQSSSTGTTTPKLPPAPIEEVKEEVGRQQAATEEEVDELEEDEVETPIPSSSRLDVSRAVESKLFLARTMAPLTRFLQRSREPPMLPGSTRDRRRLDQVADALRKHRKALVPHVVEISVTSIKAPFKWIPIGATSSQSSRSSEVELKIEMSVFGHPQSTSKLPKPTTKLLMTSTATARFFDSQDDIRWDLKPVPGQTPTFEVRLALADLAKVTLRVRCFCAQSDHFVFHTAKLILFDAAKQSPPDREPKPRCWSIRRSDEETSDQGLLLKCKWRDAVPWSTPCSRRPAVLSSFADGKVGIKVTRPACRHCTLSEAGFTALLAGESPKVELASPPVTESEEVSFRNDVEAMLLRALEEDVGALVSPRRLALALERVALGRADPEWRWELQVRKEASEGVPAVHVRVLHKPCLLSALDHKLRPTPMDEVEHHRKLLDALTGTGIPQTIVTAKSGRKRKLVRVPKRGVLVRSETKERYEVGELVSESEEEGGDNYAWRDMRSARAQQLYGELDDRTVFLKTLWNAFSRRHACFELCSALGVGTIAQDFIAAHASDVKRADARSALAVLLQSLAQAELLQGGTAKVVELIKAFDAAC